MKLYEITNNDIFIKLKYIVYTIIEENYTAVV